MKTSRLLILFSVACLTVGCVTKPKRPPGNPTVTAAARLPSPQAPVKDAIAISSDAAVQAATTRAKLAEAQVAVAEYKTRDYNELRALSAGLVERNAATAEELLEVHTRVVAAEARIDNLLDRLQQISDDLASERALREQISVKLVEAHAAVAAKEAEADQLRQQFEDQKVTTTAFETNAKANFESAQTSLTRAARMEGQRNLLIKVLLGVVVVLILSLAVNYLQFRT